MGKQKNNKKTGIYKGLKGWEVNYLKQAQKYGHLTTDSSERHSTYDRPQRRTDAVKKPKSW